MKKMKKLLFVLLSVAMLAACGGNTYNVSGRIGGLADGDTVTICDISTGSLLPIDTAFVSDGKFAFKGTTDTCSVCVLTFTENGMMQTCTFFLEPGRIKINYADQVQNVSGTKVNDAFQKFYDEVAKVEEKAMSLDQRAQQAQTKGESLESYQDEMNDLQDMYKQIVRKSIQDNTDNLFGYNQLLDSYSMFEPEELQELLNAFQTTYGDEEYIQQLSAMVASQLKSAVGQQYMDCVAEDVDANEHNLSEYVADNKLILLDFWASWCAPCRNEIPYMKEAYGKYHSQGFEIVSLSVDEDIDAWKAALEEEGMTWPQLYNSESGEGTPAYLYAVTMIPTSFLIDGDGTIIARNLRGEEYEATLADFFK